MNSPAQKQLAEGSLPGPVPAGPVSPPVPAVVPPSAPVSVLVPPPSTPQTVGSSVGPVEPEEAPVVVPVATGGGGGSTASLVWSSPHAEIAPHGPRANKKIAARDRVMSPTIDEAKSRLLTVYWNRRGSVYVREPG